MWSILTPQTGAALTPPHQRSLFPEQRASQRPSAQAECRGRLLTEVSSPKRHIHTQSLYLRLKENHWGEDCKVHRVRGPESLLHRYERKVVLMKSQQHGFLSSQHHQLPCCHWRTKYQGLCPYTRTTDNECRCEKTWRGLVRATSLHWLSMSSSQLKKHVHSCNIK